LLYTGLARGDVVRLGKQHVSNGIITFRMEKNRGDGVLSPPMLPVLAKTIAASKTGDLTFLVTERGMPLHAYRRARIALTGSDENDHQATATAAPAAHSEAVLPGWTARYLRRRLAQPPGVQSQAARRRQDLRHSRNRHGARLEVAMVGRPP
jgi:hypothetical protein